jgi:hypothetical protein
MIRVSGRTVNEPSPAVRLTGRGRIEIVVICAWLRPGKAVNMIKRIRDLFNMLSFRGANLSEYSCLASTMN